MGPLFYTYVHEKSNKLFNLQGITFDFFGLVFDFVFFNRLFVKCNFLSVLLIMINRRLL